MKSSRRWYSFSRRSSVANRLPNETMPLANCSLLKDKAYKECNSLNRRVEFSIKASCSTCK